MTSGTRDAPPDGVPGPSGPSSSRRARWVVGVVAITTIAAATLAGFVLGHAAGPTAGETNPAPSTTLATVARRSLASQIQASATLGYEGTYRVVVPPGGGPQAAGTFTALPTIGQVIEQGQRLYAVNGSPTVLLYGTTPAYRSLSEGMTGDDVLQLNAALAAIDPQDSGLDPQSSDYTAATSRAVARLQASSGLPATGSLPAGEVVFLPTAARVTSVPATLGGPAQPGASVLQATSTIRLVFCQLDAAQQSEVKPGDQVTVTLPSQRTTPGVVSSVGNIATTGSLGSGTSGGGTTGSGGTPTVEVQVTLADPAAAGDLDQAPVNITITTATLDDALVVPVAALLAQASGGYAVEVVDADGSHHLASVQLGLFDDADGLVQISGAEISAGQQVVVPTI